ncbi:suppressor of white-apricot [Carabus blaptoides fortunei]
MIGVYNVKCLPCGRDLLVFGYACKLFRDDEKALEIDQGKHLIPWMGDNSLKIDRYDGRGTLSDLTPYQSSKEGYDAMRWLGLSEAERRIEQHCDEERYYALRKNEEEENLYKEEELKRAQNQSNQFQYSYEQEPKTEGPTLPPEEDDEPFVPPPELDIPVNITLPTTVKQNARIEKTALFISKEGPQMEILLKTKQSGNPQFAFMTQDDPLYRYYRHVLMAIKTGRYTVANKNSQTDDKGEKHEEDHYLHPSLAAVSVTNVESTIPLPLVNYKPSADCAYSQLVNRIQGNQPVHDVAPPEQSVANSAHAMYNHPAYIQHYQQFGYYPQYDANNPYYAQYDQYQMQYGTYAQPTTKHEPNPYAQIVSNVKSKSEAPALSEKTVDSTPTTNPVQNGSYPRNYGQLDATYYRENHTEITKAPILYTNQSETVVPESSKLAVVQQPVAQPLVVQPVTVVVAPVQPSVGVPKQPLFALAQYSGSESECENDEDESDGAHAVVIPPAETQQIIDKMASYVTKNGSDFEAIVSSKGDPRFVFLQSTHEFHPYYKYKLKEYGALTENNKMENKTESTNKEEVPNELKEEDKTEKKAVKGKEKKIITPVCFSIKKPRDTDAVARDKSALPIEDSTEDEEETQEQTEITSPTDEAPADVSENRNETENVNSTSIIEIEDPIMELIDLTDDLEERRDTKRAEDRVKDKLAAAAREKLATKNRALQLERKKRAAAFLSQLKPLGTQTTSNSFEEIKTVRATTSEDGEIISEPSQAEDVSRFVYHVDGKSPNISDKEHRSRSNSRHRHKSSSHHKRKTRKRSHSHSRKRKRERRSRDRKKSKRRHRSRSGSRSRSQTRHRKSERREDSVDNEKHKSKRENIGHSSHSSDYESD